MTRFTKLLKGSILAPGGALASRLTVTRELSASEDPACTVSRDRRHQPLHAGGREGDRRRCEVQGRFSRPNGKAVSRRGAGQSDRDFPHVNSPEFLAEEMRTSGGVRISLNFLCY